MIRNKEFERILPIKLSLLPGTKGIGRQIQLGSTMYAHTIVMHIEFAHCSLQNPMFYGLLSTEHR